MRNAVAVDTASTPSKAGGPVITARLYAHFLSGGEVTHVVPAPLVAVKAGIPLYYNRACAIDLACKGTGKTVLEAVRTSINPKVIDCPHPDMGRGGKIDAVAKDGISLRVRARVTVRTNLDRFVGGATEETVVARVGEGIVTCIGSSMSYKDVLENPDSISKLVLHKGVDAGTAFEILSIDIADIDVGENVGDCAGSRSDVFESIAPEIIGGQRARAALCVSAAALRALRHDDSWRLAGP